MAFKIFGQPHPSIYDLAKPGEGLILPESVRWRLKYANGEMGSAEIKSLAVNGFDAASQYLVLKALGKQQNKEGYAGTLNKIIHGYSITDDIDELVGKTTIDGHKASITTGLSVFGDWKMGYVNASADIQSNGLTPFLIAHSTMLGLSEFIEDHDHVGILVPEWYGDDICGFEVIDGEVYSLSPDFSAFDQICLVDDTIDSGVHITAAQETWAVHGGASPEIKIVFDARMHPYVSKA